MKYMQKDFTPELADEIKKKESAIQDYIENQFLDTIKNAFTKTDLVVDATFDQNGTNPFEPGYGSSISIGISEKSGELIDVHTINIWECERSLLGMPVSKNFPGSKVTGELLDESLTDIKAELKEYVQEILEYEKESV